MLIATPNLTIDRTLRLDRLEPGAVQRPASVAVTPGGKGVNVARVARALAAPATLVGLVPGHTGLAVAALLADEGIELIGVAVDGEVRAAIVVLEDGGRVTVLNEPGPALAAADAAAYLTAVEGALADHRVVVASGSLPPGAPDGLYGRVVALAHRRGRTVVVDAARAALLAALPARPDVVTPNLAEAEGALAGHRHEPVEAGIRGDQAVERRALDAAAALVARGAKAALVSVGRAGVAAVTAEDRWWVDAPAVTEVSPVGAGDALVGGLVVALEAGLDLRAASAAGVAAAAASVETALAGGVDPARVRALAAIVAPRAALDAPPGADRDGHGSSASGPVVRIADRLFGRTVG